MAKIDLDTLNIEELAALREKITEMLAEKVAARHRELEAEMERISQYGKTTKKSAGSAPVAKAKKRDEKSNEARNDGSSGEIADPVADAA